MVVIANSVVARCVSQYRNQLFYAIFYGKQSELTEHYGTKNRAQTRQRITETLTQPDQSARRKTGSYQKDHAPFTDRLEGETLYCSYTAASVAQLIRKVLERAFPTIEFSVTSSTFANGSSVDIAYTNGSSSRQIE